MKKITHAIDETLNLLNEVGIDANGLISDSTVFLASKNELNQLSNIKNCIGLALYSKDYFFIGRYPAKIYLLNTLTRPRLESVLGHEIFHIYSGYNKLQLSRKMEEGVAELISFYIYQRIGEFATIHRQREMLQNPDNIYGDGFREAYEATKMAGGIKNYISQIIPKPRQINESHKVFNKFENLWQLPNETPQKVNDIWWKSEINLFPVTEKSWWKY